MPTVPVEAEKGVGRKGQGSWQPVTSPQTMPLEQALGALAQNDKESVSKAARAAARRKDGGAGRLALAASYSASQRCEARGFGPVPDPATPSCWDFCLGLHSLGARLCCDAGSCYRGPTDSCPLGLCATCPRWVEAPALGTVCVSHLCACV
jgi:hypothetical protein